MTTAPLPDHPEIAFDELGRFLIDDYHTQRPFSSFLPGIAGEWGVPLWAFYVNRGQGLASLGIENKDQAILEFLPANKAYRQTAYQGFRTFLKLEREGNPTLYEPFAPWSPGSPRRQMQIGMNELGLTELSEWAGLKSEVLYFILPDEPFAGLVRTLQIRNISQGSLSLQLLDGLPALIPYGADNGALKHVGRTIEAWMQVENLPEKVPFYRLRASAGDEAEVTAIAAGHFALGLDQEQGLLPVIADPDLVFANDSALYQPQGFIEHSLEDLLSRSQATSGKTPCAFFGLERTLQPGESVRVVSLIGHVTGLENLTREVPRLTQAGYTADKLQAARQLAEQLTNPILTQTALPAFDAYTRQTFLDNVLRGGWPTLIGEGPQQQVYHLYSRKHGDLERDYNDFLVPGEFFSSGNGNYRDVNQNRRRDVLFNPRVKDHNINTFLSLIQLDGYNPLVLRGTTYTVPASHRVELLKRVDQPDLLEPILSDKFTPGGLLKFIFDQNLSLSVTPQEFLVEIIDQAAPQLEADFGVGFWIDHWTYLLDQIESYLALYPDKKTDLLFSGRELPYFQSPVQVLPRRKRHVLTENGPRQYHSLTQTGKSGWAQKANGERYTSSVIAKLILLAGLKFGTLDPAGMGVEMEAGKPGWYDALNGLPGLFGSSLPESYELLRLIRFLRESLVECGMEHEVDLPSQLGDFLKELAALTQAEQDPFSWWQAANQLREAYRQGIYSDFSGRDQTLTGSDLDEILQVFQARLEEGIARAEEHTEGIIPPTYFRFEVTQYQLITDTSGKEETDSQGRPYLVAKEFQAQALPLFLEGAVRSLKAKTQEEYPPQLHTAVKDSPLYDPKLDMFKLNAPLAQEPHEIGRARAFTPGWLENESIWLHMAFKYLLGLLQSGLYQEFWEAARNGMPPFQPPTRYGRSTLENSSFLVSSAHPDESLHGAGFVARLSGSTAEFVHIWTLAMAGKSPFQVSDGQLICSLHPALPAWMFDEQDQVRFNFLGSIPVTYHNPGREDTWKLVPQGYKIETLDGETIQLTGAEIPSPQAERIRNQQVKSIEIVLRRGHSS